jgi:2-hydroxychromene-2-carboxylate isomerase
VEHVDWYVDFLSPFVYLHACRLRTLLPGGFELRPRPILFSAVLKHWAHKGPADIPPKGEFAFRQVRWLAARLGVPYQFPPHHPFKPLPPLRLAIALGERRDVVEEILRFIWAEGRDVDDPDAWHELTTRLGVANADTLIEAEWVKAKLRANTEAALAAGVFGIPTAIACDTLFWGSDSTEMMVEYLRGEAIGSGPGRQTEGATANV